MSDPLYEITGRYLAAIETLEESDFDEQTIKDTLESLEGEIEDKAINVAKYIRNIEADGAAIANAIAQMKERKSVYDARASALRSYLLRNMEACRIKEVSCPFFAVKIKNNPPSVDLFSPNLIPQKYVKIRSETYFDKAAIARDIKAGTPVQGATLSRGKRVDIK